MEHDEQHEHREQGVDHELVNEEGGLDCGLGHR